MRFWLRLSFCRWRARISERRLTLVCMLRTLAALLVLPPRREVLSSLMFGQMSRASCGASGTDGPATFTRTVLVNLLSFRALMACLICRDSCVIPLGLIGMMSPMLTCSVPGLTPLLLPLDGGVCGATALTRANISTFRSCGKCVKRLVTPCARRDFGTFGFSYCVIPRCASVLWRRVGQVPRKSTGCCGLSCLSSSLPACSSASFTSVRRATRRMLLRGTSLRALILFLTPLGGPRAFLVDASRRLILCCLPRNGRGSCLIWERLRLGRSRTTGACPRATLTVLPPRNLTWNVPRAFCACGSGVPRSRLSLLTAGFVTFCGKGFILILGLLLLVAVSAPLCLLLLLLLLLSSGRGRLALRVLPVGFARLMSP